jgi:hypothetical protein
MPYMRVGKCVFKKNPDGSRGESRGCSDSVEMARKHMGALYAAESGADMRNKEYKSMYVVTEEDDQYCICELSPDGSISEPMGMYPTMEEAVSHMQMMEEDDKNFGVSFKQDASGQWWFIGTYSNKFKDRDEEIISEAAHKEYAQWLKETGVRPQITLYHQPQKPGFWSIVMKAYDMGLIKTKTLNALMKDFYKEFAIAETERVIPANGFNVVVGKVYEHRIKNIKYMKSTDLRWGMSHGFVTLNNHDNIFEKYRSFEFTVLKQSRAANVWTESQFMEVQEMPLMEEDKQLLDKIQAGLADEIENKTADKAAQLEGAGVEFKETQTEEVVVTEEVASEGNKAVDPNVILEQLKVALNLDGLVEAVKAEITKLDEKITAIDGRIKVVEQDEDSKIASIYQPNWQKAFAAATAPESNKTEEVDSKKEALKGWDTAPSQLFWGNVFETK